MEEIEGTYSITYLDLEDADNSGNPEVVAEDAVIDLADPVRIGYRFLGWYLVPDQVRYYSIEEQPVVGDLLVESDITLRAEWEPIEFPVDFLINYDSSLYWNWEGGFDEEDVLEYVMFDYYGSEGSDYTEGSYTVRFGDYYFFDYNDQNQITMEKPLSFIYYIFEEEVNDYLAPEGYLFDGWYTTSTPGTGIEIQVDTKVSKETVNNIGSQALYTRWYAVDYDITYNLDGGTNSDDNPDTYTIEDTVELADATKTGHEFDGWYDAATAGTEVEGFEGDYGDEELWAYWSVGEYDVTFNANGGTGSMSSQTITFNDSETLTANTFTKDYSDFLGWATSSDAEEAAYVDEASYTMEAEGVTLYAVWDTAEYDVIFDSNGGTGTMEEQSIEYGTSEDLSANSFVRTGYSFAGWATDSDAEEADYADKASYTMNSEGDTLYAVWSPATDTAYTVKHYKQQVDGEFPATPDETDDDLTGTTGATVELDSVKNSYTGFVFDQEMGDALDLAADEIKILADESLVIELYYNRETFTVSYDGNHDGVIGVPSDDTTVRYGAKISAPSVTGMSNEDETVEFDGWYTDAAGTEEWDFDSDTVSENITLYANWVDTYEVGDATDDGFIAYVNSAYNYEESVSADNYKYLEVQEVSGSFSVWDEIDISSYSGWILPDTDELTVVYNNLHDADSDTYVGTEITLADAPYWSSENNATAETAVYVDFSDGTEKSVDYDYGSYRYVIVRYLPVETHI